MITPRSRRLNLLLALASLVPGSKLPAASNEVSNVTVRDFGRLADGRQAHLFTLKSDSGFQADISDFGGFVVRLLAPDRHGKLTDVVLGFDDVSVYEQRAKYVGALIGRVSGRIANGRFTLDGQEVQLSVNEHRKGGVANHLHGGAYGFNSVLWNAEPTKREGQPALLLAHVFPDGEDGYPGNLKVQICYSLTRDQGLRIDYTATTDKPTPVNFTQHAFFNLAGEGNGTILDEVMTIHARYYTPVKSSLIPTGEIAPVAGSPLDFTVPHKIGERVEYLPVTRGYDHTFVLDDYDGTLKLQATVLDSGSGLFMEVLTTEPGIQLFTANFFDGSLIGKSGHPYPQYAGFCLETQHFADSVNHAHFPSTILRPGETFQSTTIYRFTTR